MNPSRFLSESYDHHPPPFLFLTYFCFTNVWQLPNIQGHSGGVLLLLRPRRQKQQHQPRPRASLISMWRLAFNQSVFLIPREFGHVHLFHPRYWCLEGLQDLFCYSLVTFSEWPWVQPRFATCAFRILESSGMADDLWLIHANTIFDLDLHCATMCNSSSIRKWDW